VIGLAKTSTISELALVGMTLEKYVGQIKAENGSASVFKHVFKPMAHDPSSLPKYWYQNLVPENLLKCHQSISRV